MNYIILHTGGGRSYARKIVNSINWIRDNKRWGNNIEQVFSVSVNHMDEIRGFIPENTTIYARAAHPTANWMRELERFESLGFIVVNSTKTLKLTSDKLACSLFLQDKVSHPKTWVYPKNMNFMDFSSMWGDIETSIDEDSEYIIAKPTTSIEQGANVRKINFQNLNVRGIKDELEIVPGDSVVIQEFIPYTALHRVIVINGEALLYTFIDKPEWHENGDWKVSCCLNRTTMQINEPRIGERAKWSDLVSLAKRTQDLIGGKINFIDIFETDSGFVISEINTACNLSIHEMLARNAGRTDWNIHYKIAKYLVQNY
jgi:glutathione synthase/RimK-type ligase-like ATP-grasp enzyme